MLYAAPEQFSRGQVGPLSDLYSLGVMLYELATGQNPFRCEDAGAVIPAHLSGEPPRANESNPELSFYFAEVIGWLLAKAPTNRPASAEALRRLLEEGGILDVGAVLGFDFDPDLVARVRERKRVQVLETLAAIERRTGVVRAQGRSYSFDHQHVQEVLHAALSEILLEDYHALLAEAFARREGYEDGEPAEGEDAVFLAWHGLHGSEPRTWLPHLGAALDHLGRAYRTDAALELADRALGAKRRLRGAERVDVLLRKAEHLNLLGRREQESGALAEALALADEGDDLARRSRVRSALGWQAHLLARNDEAHRLLIEATDLAKEGELRREEAAAVGALGVVYALTGRHAEALERFERHLAIARETGDPGGEVVATGRAGSMYSTLGDIRKALEHMEASRLLATEIGNRERRGVDSMNLGEVVSQLGRSSQARERLEEARSVFRSIGALGYEASALQYLAALEAQVGHGEEAESLYLESLSLRHKVQDRRGEVRGRIGLGRLRKSREDESGARTVLEEARQVAEGIGAPELEAYALAHLATLPGGDPAAAREAVAAHGSRLEYVQTMDAHHAIWKAGGDRADLERSWSMLTRLRENAPEEYRDSLVDEVPLHREIVEAWSGGPDCNGDGAR